MSYVKKTTLEDFDEAYRYGATLTIDELERFDKLIDKVSKEFGENSVITQTLLSVREEFL